MCSECDPARAGRILKLGNNRLYTRNNRWQFSLLHLFALTRKYRTGSITNKIVSKHNNGKRYINNHLKGAAAIMQHMNL